MQCNVSVAIRHKMTQNDKKRYEIMQNNTKCCKMTINHKNDDRKQHKTTQKDTNSGGKISP